MEEEETRLRFAIIVQVGNASRDFSPSDVSAAVAEITGLGADHFPTFPAYPESYLIICATQDARDRALNANPVPIAATYLSLRPWTRLVRANSSVLYNRVTIEMDGIPEHAWDLDTASKLLPKHVWIERLAPATSNKTDLSTFRLTAWTADPHSIPGSKTLCIAEPEPRVVHADEQMERIFANVLPYLRQKTIMRYPIHIHLRAIADFSSRTTSPSSSSPSDDGDSGPDGNPDRSYGFRSGTGPRLSGFPRRQIGGGGAGTTATGREAPECSRRFAVGPMAGQSTAAKPAPTTVRPENSNPLCATTPIEGDGATVADKAKLSPTRQPQRVAEDRAQVCGNTARWTQKLRELDPMVIEAKMAGPDAAPKAAQAASACDASPVPVPPSPPAAQPEATDVVTVNMTPVATTAGLDEIVPAAGTPGTGDPAVQAATDPMEPTPSEPEAQPVAHAMTVLPDDDISTPVFKQAIQKTPVNKALQAQTSSPVEPSPPPPGHDSDHDEPNSPPGFSRAQSRSDTAKLRTFMAHVEAKIQTPLAPRPAKMKRAAASPRACDKLPKRSARLAAHPLSNVASSKRAEVVLMCRFDMIPETASTPTTEGRKAYQKLYRTGVQSDQFEAMSDLLLALRNVSPILGMQA
ncbi:unnamed protein product [Urochloa humidicola]